MLKIISRAVKEMSEGELLQLKNLNNINITEDLYYEISRKKQLHSLLVVARLDHIVQINQTRKLLKRCGK